MDRRKVVEEKSGKLVHGYIVEVFHWKIQKPEGNQKIFHHGSNGIRAICFGQWIYFWYRMD